MLGVLSITLPVFAVMAVGYVAVRYGPLTSITMKSLGEFTLLVTLPFALFNAVSTRSFAEVVNPSYLLTLAAGGLATQVLMRVIVRLQSVGPKRRALAVLSSATPNTAFLGFPIYLMVIPDHAGPVLAMNLLVENVLLNPIGLILLGRAESEGEVSPLRLMGRIGLSVIRRPLIIGLMAGFALVLLDVTPPDGVIRFTGLLGQAAAPIALVVVGGTLVGLNLKGDMGLASQMALVKLLVHPALVIGALALLAGAGLVQMGPELRTGLILTACLPTFSTLVLFAQEAGHEGLASIALMLCTCLSFVTVNLALLLLAG